MSKSGSIHPTAVVSPEAQLEPGVRVGPFCVVGEEVKIGAGTVLGPYCWLEGPTVLGKENHVFGQACLGIDPQDLKYRGERSTLEIGDGNRIREFVTVHRGTETGSGKTVVGDGNLLMTGVHVAHDCLVGNQTILANSATLAGHVEVGDFATVGAFCGVHQFCRVGAHAFIGGYSVLTRDALPFIKTVGSRGEAATFGVNVIGLQRRGFSEERILALKRAYRILLQRETRIKEAIEAVLREVEVTEDVLELIRFIQSAERGFARAPGKTPREED